MQRVARDDYLNALTVRKLSRDTSRNYAAWDSWYFFMRYSPDTISVSGKCPSSLPKTGIEA